MSNDLSTFMIIQGELSSILSLNFYLSMHVETGTGLVRRTGKFDNL